MHCFLSAHNKLQCIHKYKIPHLSLQHSLCHTHRSLRTMGYFSKISGVLEFSLQSASLAAASLHHIHEVTQAHMLPLSLVVTHTHTHIHKRSVYLRAEQCRLFCVDSRRLKRSNAGVTGGKETREQEERQWRRRTDAASGAPELPTESSLMWAYIISKFPPELDGARVKKLCLMRDRERERDGDGWHK